MLASGTSVVEGYSKAKRMGKVEKAGLAASYKGNEERKLSSLAKKPRSHRWSHVCRGVGSRSCQDTARVHSLNFSSHTLCVFTLSLPSLDSRCLILSTRISGNEVALRIAYVKRGLHYPIGITRVHNILATGHNNLFRTPYLRLFGRSL